jgi:hypothetical protein
MIKQYASLDPKEEGCFGYHPIMDYSRTCNAKVSSNACQQKECKNVKVTMYALQILHKSYIKEQYHKL